MYKEIIQHFHRTILYKEKNFKLVLYKAQNKSITMDYGSPHQRVNEY